MNSDTQDSQNGQKRIKQSLPEIIGPILPPHLRHLGICLVIFSMRCIESNNTSIYRRQEEDQAYNVLVIYESRLKKIPKKFHAVTVKCELV